MQKRYSVSVNMIETHSISQNSATNRLSLVVRAVMSRFECETNKAFLYPGHDMHLIAAIISTHEIILAIVPYVSSCRFWIANGFINLQIYTQVSRVGSIGISPFFV